MKEEQREILQKIYSYCTYQERSLKEVREKLLQLGAEPLRCEEILVHLQEEKYVDEFRFAREFAHGKFANNKWGKKKIAHELAAKGVTDTLIRQALAMEISEEEYRQTLEKLFELKKKELAGFRTQEIQNKIVRYLLQKGYEWEAISTLL